jgi:uncharacterized protein YuzE
MDKYQYIKIQNFRCFKKLKVNGFKRVNLIAGKNNLLEFDGEGAICAITMEHASQRADINQVIVILIKIETEKSFNLKDSSYLNCLRLIRNDYTMEGIAA